MPTNFITLPRSQIYELVWTKPVTELAKEFGISDVALAKRCRNLNIPLPPRGYWARVAAGQSPKRPRLPGFHDPRAQPSRSAPTARERPPVASASLPSYVSTRDQHGPLLEPTITFAPPPEPRPDDAAAPLSPVEAALRARLDALDLTPSTDLKAAHPAVLRTAVHLKRLKQKDITWPRGARSGPLLEMTNVAEPQRDRALRVLDTVLRTAEALGWPFEPPPADPTAHRQQTFARSDVRPPLYGHLVVEGEPITLRIDERRRQSDHVMTEQEKADQKRGTLFWMPRFDFAPSGELRLHATEPEHSYRSTTWKDTRTRPLETQAQKILHGLLTIALDRRRHREEERLRQIEERKQERLRELVRQRRAAHGKLIHTLEAQAGAWHRAQYLRRYLRAARRTLGSRTLTVELESQSTDFLAWAERYVNQLDPLHAEPRSPDFAHEHSWQYNSEEKRFTEELQRLLGHLWEAATKAVAVAAS